MTPATTQQGRWQRLFGAPDGRNLAIAIEGLYLLNLLALPGLAFAVLAWLWTRRATLPALACCHLRQAVSGSLWALGMLLGFNGLVLWWLGTDVLAAWLFVLLYFLTFHSMLVLIGMFGLARAMAGEPYRFPIVGVACATEAPRARV